MIDPLSLWPVEASAPREELVALQRAVAEVRRGEPVAIAGPGGLAVLALAAELATAPALARLRAEPGRLLLAVTARRAAVLGFPATAAGPVAIPLGAQAGPEEIATLADPTRRPNRPAAGWSLGPADIEASELAAAAIRLMHVARLLPAALVLPLPDGALPGLAAARNLLTVAADAIGAHGASGCSALARVAEARVPLAGAENARVIAFRPADGGAEHLAIVIGAPDAAQPVLTRIHSECLTGDLLGSLRCDCGEQLRGAIAAIGRAGSGVLIYLAQEGRGIGLVNKLRAYELQDGGVDTVEANSVLGFEPDERLFQPAAEMLQALGIAAVRLMTNNPEKVRALARHGITVAERVPHRFRANGHNEAYLQAKARGLGHLF